MGELRKIDVELEETTASFVDHLVASNRFSSPSQVVGYALALAAERERDDEQAWQATLGSYGMERLRALIDEGLASGEPIEATDDLFEDVKHCGRERLARARAAE